jgi:hypothetical protein
MVCAGDGNQPKPATNLGTQEIDGGASERATLTPAKEAMVQPFGEQYRYIDTRVSQSTGILFALAAQAIVLCNGENGRGKTTQVACQKRRQFRVVPVGITRIECAKGRALPDRQIQTIWVLGRRWHRADIRRRIHQQLQREDRSSDPASTQRVRCGDVPTCAVPGYTESLRVEAEIIGMVRYPGDSDRGILNRRRVRILRRLAVLHRREPDIPCAAQTPHR